MGYTVYELHCKKVNNVLEIRDIQKVTFVLLNLTKRRILGRLSLPAFSQNRKKMNVSLNINSCVDEEGGGKICIDLTLAMSQCFCVKVRSHSVQKPSESSLLGPSHCSIVFYAILVSDSVSPCLNKMKVLILNKTLIRPT